MRSRPVLSLRCGSGRYEDGTGSCAPTGVDGGASTRTYLLLYSAGNWRTAFYNTSFARCASPAGPCTQDTRGPFLKTGNGRSGVGGLTLFRDAQGTLRAAYASWKQGSESPTTNPAGTLSRRTHWATVRLGATTDPAAQSVSLG